jgi:hypothetical protein
MNFPYCNTPLSGYVEAGTPGISEDAFPFTFLQHTIITNYVSKCS